MTYDLDIVVVDNRSVKYRATLSGSVKDIEKAYARVKNIKSFAVEELIKIFNNADKFEDIRTHMTGYPDELNEKYRIYTDLYPRFNSVRFLTDLEKWHKKLEEFLGAE